MMCFLKISELSHWFSRNSNSMRSKKINMYVFSTVKYERNKERYFIWNAPHTMGWPGRWICTDPAPSCWFSFWWSRALTGWPPTTPAPPRSFVRFALATSWCSPSSYLKHDGKGKRTQDESENKTATATANTTALPDVHLNYKRTQCLIG